MATVPYLYAISKTTQTILVADVPQKIDIDTQKIINDISLNLDENEITIEEGGLYYVSIVVQVGREDTCAAEVPNVRFFVKNNDIDISDSTSLINVNRHRETKGAYSKDFLLDLSIDDVLSFWVSSNIDGLTKLEYIDQSGEPDAPSFSLVIFKLSADGESDCL